MSEEEREVLKTFKKGLGLTSAEQEILVNYIDKLQKENKEYIDIFNATEKIMNGQERTKDKLLKENVELQKENEELSQANFSFLEINQKLIEEKPIIKELTKKEFNLLKENEQLTNELSKIQCDNRQLELELEKANKQLDLDYVDNNFISKDIIRNKIKEYNEQRKKAETKEINDMFVNYIDILEELLGE